ncbi:30S ribosomal protein S17e [Candidatus Woesearchaeota archaeon]|nr:30S ribosomal protein S17e [Candidatus Woesearchaeota archaeon]
MGRIKTTLIKKRATELKLKHPTNFNNDFEYNKQEVIKFADIPSKKLRNTIAGYITKLKKQEELKEDKK